MYAGKNEDFERIGGVGGNAPKCVFWRGESFFEGFAIETGVIMFFRGPEGDSIGTCHGKKHSFFRVGNGVLGKRPNRPAEMTAAVAGLYILREVW